MKKISIIALMLLLTVSFWNCEKDDLCAASIAKTPRVVIEFYDSVTTDELKEVTLLAYFDNTTNDTLTADAVSKIMVPLKTSDDSVVFKFVLNGNDTDTSDDNTDQITFNYTRENIYISRACGYKTIFTLNDLDGIELLNDTDNWIQNITVEQPSIDNENETHVKIYF